MKPAIVSLIIILAFLGGDNVLTSIGYPHHDFTSPILFRLHPLSYIAALLLVYYLLNGKLKFSAMYRTMGNEAWFILFNILTLCLLQITGNLSAISFLLDAIWLPAILSILLKITDKGILFKFKSWLYAFFFLNAALSIVEKILHKSLIAKEIFESDYFRSSAIYGHPLNNGLITAVLTLILFLGTEKNWLKALVLFSGITSIFCFGARGALIGVIAGIFLNLLINALSSTHKHSRHVTIAKGAAFAALFALMLFVIANYTSLGDRILGLSHVDDSALTRLDSYNVLHGIALKDLLWGFGTDKIEYLQYISGVDIIENFYIVWVLKCGIIAATLLLIMLIGFLFRLMRNSGPGIRLPVLITTFMVASTNNSLSSNTLVLSILVLSYYIFFESKDICFNYTVPKPPPLCEFAI